jgi:formylglycine-generating enzyme required for sulfatase activity
MRTAYGPILAPVQPRLPLGLVASIAGGVGIIWLGATAPAPASVSARLATPPETPAAVAGCAWAQGSAPPFVGVPAGSIRPFFKTDVAAIAVGAFQIAAQPVTTAEFLGFLQCHPEWRRSRATASLSEATYLAEFRSDLDPGPMQLAAPVTSVSWFSARAYCESHGWRLPTTVEWERALGAAAAATVSEDARAIGSKLEFAMGRPAPDLQASPLAARGVWEWTSDFNSAPGATGANPSQFCGDGMRSNAPDDYAAFLRYSLRSSLKAGYALKNLGFRCAKDGAP